MYSLPKFLPKNNAHVRSLIEQFPLGILQSVEGDKIETSAIPFIFGERETVIFGHMARGNSHWKILKNKPKGSLLFQGPNHYITPSWYPSGDDVPTWNYLMIEMQVSVRLVEKFEELGPLLKKQAERFETSINGRWKFYQPEDLRDPEVVERSIVGLEVTLLEIQAKFKLGQGRSNEDIVGTCRGLKLLNTPRSSELADWMERVLDFSKMEST